MTDRLAFPRTHPSPTMLGAALGAVTVLCWASFNVAAVHGLRTGLHPIDLMLLRFGTAGLLLLPPLVWLWLGAGPSMGWPTLRQTVGLAMLSGPLFGMLAVSGYAYAPLSHGMVIAPAAVFAVGTALAVFVIGERVRPPQLAGGLVVMTGLVVLGDGVSGELRPGAWRGGLLFAAAGTMWAGFTVAMRRWSIDPLRGTLAVGATSGLMAPAVFGIASLMGLPSGFSTAPTDAIAIQAVLQGLVGGVLAVAALISAARLLGAATAALLPSFTPIVALALAVPSLGDWPTGAELLGVVIAAIGLGIAGRARRAR